MTPYQVRGRLWQSQGGEDTPHRDCHTRLRRVRNDNFYYHSVRRHGIQKVIPLDTDWSLPRSR